MKKSFRKLQLSRETIGSLDRLDLRVINGGTGPTTGLQTSMACDLATQCECQSEVGCGGNTWEHTCTILCCSTMAHC